MPVEEKTDQREADEKVVEIELEAAHMCRLFYQGKTTSPNLETIIARNIIPIRPDRHRERKLTAKVFHGFLYRVA